MAFAPRSREAGLVSVLAVLAALRVFAFASAFPFFTSVDEHMHVDLSLKYARGYLPRPGNAAYEPEMPKLLGIYGSPEYHIPADVRRERGVKPPTWRRSSAELLEMIEYNERWLENRINLEAHQPPLYYAIAGAWVALGRAVGLDGGRLLYGIRQLHALFAFALVLVSWRFLRELYPGDPLLRLGVPVLLVAFPTDVVYYVTPDALSPLVVGTGFFLALRLALVERSAKAHVAAGAAVAAAVLVKYTNAPLLLALALATLAALWRRPRARRLRGEGGRWLVTWGVASLPIGLWLLRNRALFGDWTGTAIKLRRMGWGTRPVAEWLDHPLFTASGARHFVGELLPSFWRGELVWAREALASRGADLFFTLTTLACLLLAALGLARRAPRERLAEGLGLALVAGYVGLMAALSLPFAFPEKGVPSAAEPFFVQGRLLSGAMAPFLLVYVRGLEVASAALGSAARPAAWIALLAVAGVALGSEIALSGEVFASPYNWFHLPRP